MIFRRVVAIRPEPPSPQHRGWIVPIEFEREKATGEPFPCDYAVSVRTTDAAKAVKAVRELYEACVAQDYEKAAQIYEEQGVIDDDMTAEDLKDIRKCFESQGIRISRLVEVGKPVLQPERGTMRVPVKYEVVATNPHVEIKKASMYVQPAEGQPDRWVIVGGGI